MVERRVKACDLVAVLMNGRLCHGFQVGLHSGERKFKVAGYDFDGVALLVVVAVDLRASQLTIITVHSGSGIQPEGAGETTGTSAALLLVFRL
jgi:hypothetical protein